MRRNYKANIRSNNSIRYNHFANEKTKNIYYKVDKEDALGINSTHCNNDLPKNQKNVRDFKDDKNSYYVTKLNCYKMYDFGQSNKTQKTLNYRSKYYKITENDFNYDDEY